MLSRIVWASSTLLRYVRIQAGHIVHCICSVLWEGGTCTPPPHNGSTEHLTKCFLEKTHEETKLPQILLLTNSYLKKKKKRKAFLLYPALSSSRDSASSRKGHSDVQNNDDVFRTVVVLSCGFRGKIFNHRFQLPDSKQEPLDIPKTGWMFLALFLLAICSVSSFLLGFLIFSSSLPHLTPGPSNNFSTALSSPPSFLFCFLFSKSSTK